MLEENQGRWLSYHELGEVLGCTPNAAGMHAMRRKWPCRASSRIGELARVLVPEDVVMRPCAAHAVEQCDARLAVPVPENEHAACDVQHMLQEIRDTVEILVTPLREQLDYERARADQAERQLAAVEGELITARVDAAGLRYQLEQACPNPGPPRSARRRFLAWRR
jgi:hypothetical protein